jgi:hypothetical protein
LIRREKIFIKIQEIKQGLVRDHKTGLTEYKVEPNVQGSYDGMGYRARDINIYTKSISILREGAGIVTHEVMRFLQFIKSKFDVNMQYPKGHEFEAFRAQGRVDPDSLGASFRRGLWKNEGLTDWSLQYRLENQRSYKP